MDVGRKPQRVLFDQRTFVLPPRRGRSGDAVGEITVDHAGNEIGEVLGVAAGRDDVILIGGIGDEAVDPRVGIDKAGYDAEPKLLPRESCQHLVDGAERIFRGLTALQRQDIGLAAIRL